MFFVAHLAAMLPEEDQIQFLAATKEIINDYDFSKCIKSKFKCKDQIELKSFPKNLLTILSRQGVDSEEYCSAMMEFAAFKARSDIDKYYKDFVYGTHSV
jgi:hypothetical protein